MFYVIQYNKATGQIMHYVGNSNAQPTADALPAFDTGQYATIQLTLPQGVYINRNMRLNFDTDPPGLEYSENPVKPDPVPVTDWPTLYAEAATDAERLDVVARRLDLK